MGEMALSHEAFGSLLQHGANSFESFTTAVIITYCLKTLTFLYKFTNLETSDVLAQLAIICLRHLPCPLNVRQCVKRMNMTFHVVNRHPACRGKIPRETC